MRTTVRKMFNISIAVIGFIVFVVFGFRALNDYGFLWQWKIPLFLGEFSKVSSEVMREEDREKRIKLTYHEPSLVDEDACTNGLCVGEYILLNDSADTIKISSLASKVFEPTGYSYDSGAFNPDTGKSEQIITHWHGTEKERYGQFDIPKTRVISMEDLTSLKSSEKTIGNYKTYIEE